MNPPLILPSGSRPHNDSRTLRDRQEAIGRKIDALANDRGEFAVDRKLVQVYTDSVLPTCTPCTYLGHPLLLDGAEQEGASATVNADSTASIPFVLLRGSVSVGDIIPIHGVGGRWVGEKNGTPTPTPTPTFPCSGTGCGNLPDTLNLAWNTPDYAISVNVTLAYNSGIWTSPCTPVTWNGYPTIRGYFVFTFCSSLFITADEYGPGCTGTPNRSWFPGLCDACSCTTASVVSCSPLMIKAGNNCPSDESIFYGTDGTNGIIITA